MKEELKELLVELLTHENIVGSWGITEIKVKKASVSFRVDAFNYQGKILIKSLNKTYSVRIDDTQFSNLGLNSIIETIDGFIETSTDYYDRIEEWIAEKRTDTQKSSNSTIQTKK